MNRRRALCALLFCLPGRIIAAEATRNPDRWPSILVNQNAVESSGARQDLTGNGITDNIRQQSSSVNVGALFIDPISDSWTVQVGVGTNLSHSETYPFVDTRSGVNVSSGTTSDNSSLTYQAGARHYFLDRALTAAGAELNPDRWPSLGMSFSGSATLGFGAGSSNGLLTQDQSSHLASVMFDFRAPLNDHWTLDPSFGGVYSTSLTPPVTGSGGTESLYRSVAFGEETEYYFVGRNLIPKDSGDNPDKWAMLHLTLSGQVLVSGNSDNIAQTGVFTNRKPSTSSYSATLGTRLPITNHMTLHFQVIGQYAQYSIPQTGTLDAVTNHTPAIQYSAQLKYYFFSKAK